MLYSTQSEIEGKHSRGPSEEPAAAHDEASIVYLSAKGIDFGARGVGFEPAEAGLRTSRYRQGTSSYARACGCLRLFPKANFGFSLVEARKPVSSLGADEPPR